MYGSDYLEGIIITALNPLWTDVAYSIQLLWNTECFNDNMSCENINLKIMFALKYLRNQHLRKMSIDKYMHCGA